MPPYFPCLLDYEGLVVFHRRMKILVGGHPVHDSLECFSTFRIKNVS